MIRWLVGTLGGLYFAAQRWQERRDGKAWLARVTKSHPRGYVVRCSCRRCQGRTWIVHSYDAQTLDVRLYEATAGPWPLAFEWTDLPVDVAVAWARPEVLTVQEPEGA